MNAFGKDRIRWSDEGGESGEGGVMVRVVRVVE